MQKDDFDFEEPSAPGEPMNFAGKFVRASCRLGLRPFLTRGELSALYQAAFAAALCNIAINGLGGCNGQIKPEREQNRIKLERAFMRARNGFYETDGWQALSLHLKRSVQGTFLRVEVAEGRFAW